MLLFYTKHIRAFIKKELCFNMSIQDNKAYPSLEVNTKCLPKSMKHKEYLQTVTSDAMILHDGNQMEVRREKRYVKGCLNKTETQSHLQKNWSFLVFSAF